MPEKGKLPEWEKKDNRKKIFLALMNKPLSHKELLEELQISRGTLSAHLRDLEEEKIIGRTRRNGKRVYEIIFDDDERIRDELNSMSFELLLDLMSDTLDPLFVDTIKSFSESLFRVMIYFKKRKLMDEPRLSTKEMIVKTYEIIKKSAPPNVAEFIQIDDFLENVRNAPESNFEELEKIQLALGKKVRERKNERKN